MTRPHERLDSAMNSRRIDLDLTWSDLAGRARIAAVTLRAIRNGTSRPSELTRHRLEDALGWSYGSILTVLNGGEPDIRVDHLGPPPATTEDELDEALEEVRRWTETVRRLVAERRGDGESTGTR